MGYRLRIQTLNLNQKNQNLRGELKITIKELSSNALHAIICAIIVTGVYIISLIVFTPIFISHGITAYIVGIAFGLSPIIGLVWLLAVFELVDDRKKRGKTTGLSHEMKELLAMAVIATSTYIAVVAIFAESFISAGLAAEFVMICIFFGCFFSIFWIVCVVQWKDEKSDK